jgi:hypothetical protein
MTHTLSAASLLLALLPLALPAASLTITATCRLNGQPDIVQDSACLIEGPAHRQETAGALGTVRVTSAPTSADFTKIQAVMAARAAYLFVNQPPPLNGNSSARLTIDFSETFLTPGPERPGFIEVKPSGGAHGFEARTEGWFTLPDATNGQSLKAGCIAQSAEAQCVNTGYFEHYRLFPVLLGTPLPITFRGLATAASSAQNTGGSATFNYEYTFRFFEADGVTPVAVTESAEPATLGLVLGPLLIIAYSYYKRLFRSQ